MSAAALLPVWLALPALAFLLVIPGFLTFQLVLSFGKPKQYLTSPKGGEAVSTQYPLKGAKSSALLSAGERVFWTLALGVMEAGWVGLILAELGLFSVGLVVAILVGWSGVAGGWLWRRGYRGEWWRAQFSWPGWKRDNLDGWVLAALIIGTTGLFFFARHETVIGGQDSGVYYNIGANIARTGAIISQDPLLKTIGEAAKDPEIGPKVLPQFTPGVAKQENRFLFARYLRLPAFFVRDNQEGLDTGEVVPQFFHLYPTYLAFGYALFGPQGAIGVTPLLGVLAVFAVYLTARRLFPNRRQKWIAPFAGLFLALNGIQVWFARQSLWEMLGEFLLFTAIYAFFLILRPVAAGVEESEDGKVAPDQGLAILGGLGAGAAFGLICLAHAQFPFLIWPLVPYLLWMRLTRRWSAAQWWLLATSGVLLLHAIVHIRLFSLAYFEGIYHHKIIDYRAILQFIIPPAAVGFFGLIIIDAMPQRVRAFEGWVRRRWRYIAWSLAGLTLVYLVYNYFIRVYDISTDGQGNYPTKFWSLSSYIGAPTTEGPERSLVRLGWYFSPPAMLLIFVGLAWLIGRKLNGRSGLFLALLAGITLVFLDTNYTQEHYIYSLRRYVVVTVPAFCIILSYALFEGLPTLFGWLGRVRLFSRVSRPVAYAQAAGATGHNIAFAIVQLPVAPLPIAPSTPSQTVSTKRGQHYGRWAGLLIALGLVFFLVWTGRTIFTLAEYGAGDGQPGLIAQLDQLAARFGPQDILLFVGDRDLDGKFATPLTYAYGRPAFVLPESIKNDEVAALLNRWEAQGYHIKALLGTNGGRFSPPGHQLKLENTVSIYLRQLEDLTTQKPYNVQMNGLSYAVYDVQKVGASANFAGSAGNGNVTTPSGWNLKMGQNDYASLVGGFYEVEKDKGDSAAYRWVENTGVVRVPCLPEGAGGKLTVTLGAGMRPAAKSNVPVTVYISNYRYSEDTGKWLSLGPVQLKQEASTFSFDLPAGAAALSCAKSETGGTANSLIVWLKGTPNTIFTPASLGNSPDTRRLNFKVYGLSLSAK